MPPVYTARFPHFNDLSSGVRRLEQDRIPELEQERADLQQKVNDSIALTPKRRAAEKALLQADEYLEHFRAMTAKRAEIETSERELNIRGKKLEEDLSRLATASPGEKNSSKLPRISEYEQFSRELETYLGDAHKYIHESSAELLEDRDELTRASLEQFQKNLNMLYRKIIEQPFYCRLEGHQKDYTPEMVDAKVKDRLLRIVLNSQVRLDEDLDDSSAQAEARRQAAAEHRNVALGPDEHVSGPREDPTQVLSGLAVSHGGNTDNTNGTQYLVAGPEQPAAKESKVLPAVLITLGSTAVVGLIAYLAYQHHVSKRAAQQAQFMQQNGPQALGGSMQGPSSMRQGFGGGSGFGGGGSGLGGGRQMQQGLAYQPSFSLGVGNNGYGYGNGNGYGIAGLNQFNNGGYQPAYNNGMGMGQLAV